MLYFVNRCPVVFDKSAVEVFTGVLWKSCNGLVTTLSEAHKLSDAPFSLLNKYTCPVLVASCNGLITTLSEAHKLLDAWFSLLNAQF